VWIARIASIAPYRVELLPHSALRCVLPGDASSGAEVRQRLHCHEAPVLHCKQRRSYFFLISLTKP